MSFDVAPIAFFVMYFGISLTIVLRRKSLWTLVIGGAIVLLLLGISVSPYSFSRTNIFSSFIRSTL